MSRTSLLSLRATGLPRSCTTVKKNVLPCPGSLSTQMRPPIIWTSCREIVNPSPVPPYRRVVPPSAWEKLSKISFCLSFGIPMPVSDSEKSSSTFFSSALSRLTSTETSPSSVNLMALPTRLTSTWRSRSGSPRTAIGTSGWTSRSSSRFFPEARWAMISASCSTTLCRS